MDPLAAIKITFFQECEEQLAELETGLLAMESGDSDLETVNAVFRAVHSIKGGAGAFSLEPLVRFAHAFETVLDDMRSGRLHTDGEVIKVMLRAADMLADHVRAARDGGHVDEDHSRALVEELGALGAGGDAQAHIDADDGMDGLDFHVVQVAFPEEEPEPLHDAEQVWTITFKPTAALYAKANEPALLLRELSRIGEASVLLDASALPSLEALEPEDSYLAWTISLRTAENESSIREIFEFVDGDCELEIKPAPDAADDEEKPSAAPDELDIMSLIALAKSASSDDASQAASTPPAPAVAEQADAKGPAPAAGLPTAAPAPAATIRVDLERVDRLIDLVGELVINQAMIAQRVVEAGLARSSNVAIGLDDLENLTREIQDSVMAIRAQPVKSVFQRMPRLVREVAAMTGKQVRLVTEGETTEVDKTVIERLSDPITHMIRNAIDHGLEPTEARLAAGKPAEGTVRLSALHRSGRIIIEVADDGGGINRSRVKTAAISKGLIAPDASLTDEETDNLIFMPGFSTAATVSDISGRGVGMDVVKRSIQALGGRISINSRPGLGSTFTLSLPLTLAVLDGMVVSIGGQTIVVPLTAVVETLQPKSDVVRQVGRHGAVIAIRDSYVPLIDVGMALGYRDTPLMPTSAVALLVENEAGTRAALMVDAIQGQRQVVIKSLEANYRHVVGIAAATILGDGRVALILDVDAVMASRPAEILQVEPSMAMAG